VARNIAIIQGHPDPHGNHFGHALAAAYAEGAEEAGHRVHWIRVASLGFPLLQTKEDFENGTPPASIQHAQEVIQHSQHLVILYPLWLGGMPAILKGFLEQVFRPAFVTGKASAAGRWNQSKLKGKSARVVITMGMPAAAYRWYYRAHSLKSLERNILGFCGISPVKDDLIGMVESESSAYRERWIEKMRLLGGKGT
jgi:putative NADPH-quinone reductase